MMEEFVQEFRKVARGRGMREDLWWRNLKDK